MDLSLFLPPLVACLVIVAIHSYLGLHVIAREVIFVDLSLAQMAALGSTVAILAGSQPDSRAAFLYALGFTTLGAALFALTRSDEKGRVPQEAIIGIVYVVASAAAILVADRTPRGGEAIKDILVGSLLWVTWPTIIRLAASMPWSGSFHWVLRRRFLTISFEPETALAQGWRIRWWDFWFYLSFGIVITFSVPDRGRAAGVLVPGGARGDRLSVHPRDRHAGRDLLARGHPRLRRRALDLVPLRSADRADRGLHVRAVAAGGVPDAKGAGGCRYGLSSGV